MTLKNGLYQAFMVSCVLCIGYSVLSLIQAKKMYDEAEKQYCLLAVKKDEIAEMAEDVKEDALTEVMKEINPDYIAWIEIDGTTIDYPIVMGGKEEYLKHNFEGDKDICGTLFINAAQAPFKDLNTIIFGHNMKNGSMFGSLKKYLDEEWLRAHPNIKIQYKGMDIFYEIFSVKIVGESDCSPYTYVFNQEEYKAFLQQALDTSVVNTGKRLEGNAILTLSTCYGKNKRLLILAEKI